MYSPTCLNLLVTASTSDLFLEGQKNTSAQGTCTRHLQETNHNSSGKLLHGKVQLVLWQVEESSLSNTNKQHDDIITDRWFFALTSGCIQCIQYISGYVTIAANVIPGPIPFLHKLQHYKRHKNLWAVRTKYSGARRTALPAALCQPSLFPLFQHLLKLQHLDLADKILTLEMEKHPFGSCTLDVGKQLLSKPLQRQGTPLNYQVPDEQSEHQRLIRTWNQRKVHHRAQWTKHVPKQFCCFFHEKWLRTRKEPASIE